MTDAQLWQEANGLPTGPVRLCIGVKLQGFHNLVFMKMLIKLNLSTTWLNSKLEKTRKPASF
jgi:hypothetical protein